MANLAADDVSVGYALHLASAAGHAEVARGLLEKRANLPVRGERFQSPPAAASRASAPFSSRVVRA